MSMEHHFCGKWITTEEFADLEVRNVFHRQLEYVNLPCDEHRNRHILFRKKVEIVKDIGKANLYITADDYYKLYINGRFVAQGPAPSYHFSYGYNVLDVTDYLQKGENTIAVHTIYHGLINRVWVSGDNRHGLLCDLVVDGETILQSDETFLTHLHTGYREIGTIGYETQFLEEYDSTALEVGFQEPAYDDSNWQRAKCRKNLDYSLELQKTKSLIIETITPAYMSRQNHVVFVDFGSCYVGYLNITALGKKGDVITVRCGQELGNDGTVRYQLRCNCIYEETWILSGETDKLDWFDYKSFRYVEIVLPQGSEITDIYLNARHYPFELKGKLKPEFAGIPEMQSIWNLCVRTQQYGVQEMIQDCMDREKGFYVGDGCYTALTNMLLTQDDSMVRKLIDDFFKSTFITPTGVTCLDCSFMQEIAEYPLYLVFLVLWHYRLSGDKEYLKTNYQGVCKLLDAFKEEYETDYLLQNLDKWCVVEWPENFQDGYDVDITEGKVCHEPHIALNAFYIEAISCANIMARILDIPAYREEQPLLDAYHNAFRNPESHLYKDSSISEHISYIGNVYTYGFQLYKDEEDKSAIEKMIESRGITGVSFFGAFSLLCGLIRHNRFDWLKEFLLDEGAWIRMLREDATTTFEGWGKDVKTNASLFHLTFSYAVIFLADIDQGYLFEK